LLKKSANKDCQTKTQLKGILLEAETLPEKDVDDEDERRQEGHRLEPRQDRRVVTRGEHLPLKVDEKHFKI